ncbi:MAG: hypothetical protein AAF570_02630, partial [Bacteroidota bacterium]
MKKIGIITLIALLATAISLPAQPDLFGQENIVQHKDLAWKVVETEHFDLHYYNSDPVMANLCAKYAEEALWDVCRMLDFKNKARYGIYLFMSPDDLVGSNMFPAPQEKEGGVTPIRTNSSHVVFPGNFKGLQTRVRTEVTRLLMENYYFGGGIQASIQNTVLLHLPDWYQKGFPAYMGEGWSFEDELWLAGLENEDLLEYVLEGNGHINHVARKSIWYFISRNYDRDKLSEIFYMTRLTRSVEDGIVHVLGIRLKTLTERWREFMLQRITENATFRQVLDDNAESIKLPLKNKRLISYELHPSKPLAALMTSDDGKLNVSIYNLKTGEVEETDIKGGFKTDQYDQFKLNFPMAWNPDGTLFITTIYKDGAEMFALYNVREKKVDYIKFQPQLERIFQITWSHDGKKIACSGLKHGTIDIYRFSPGSNRFIPITEDLFDNIHPVFSQDDQRIYYASTRPNDSIKPEEVRFDIYENHFDIWEFSLNAEKDENPLRAITQSPIIDEFPVRALSSFELLLRTNESGIYNLQKVNVFLNEFEILTNLTQGMESVDMNDSLVLFAAPMLGELSLYKAPREVLLKKQVAMQSILRLQADKDWAIKQRSKALKSSLDSIRRNLIDPKKDKPKGKDKTDKTDDKKDDKKDVKYYVFDEEDEDKKPRRRKDRQEQHGENGVADSHSD